MPAPQSPTHELGLVMAGAVSAGAYTAGVVDFLVRALDAWQAARDRGDDRAPDHRLRLTAVSGASGGAMNAAILAGIVAGRPYRPIGVDDPGLAVDDNPLFDSWVNRIDIDRLLDNGDLAGPGERRLLSLLNGDVLEGIAAAALPPGSGGQQRPWAGDGVALAFTITNLRGVPYSIGFGAGPTAGSTQAGHGMRRHADSLRFQLGEPAASAGGGGVAALDWAGQGPGWAALRQAALASGAFPLLLPPHPLQRSPDDYDGQLWPVADPGPPDLPHSECVRYRPLSPHWGESGPPERYQFVAVDGGMLDNEPYALGRELLVGTPPRAPDAGVLGRTLLAIDPFPDVTGFRHDEPQPAGLLDLALGLLTAMKNQTRFRPEELVTAADDRYAQRLLLAPSRRVDDARVRHPLAGGAVHGFAGFLDRRFRLHDFQLGRHNCQRFLALHYRLPGAHPLFANWTPAQRQAAAGPDGRLPILPLLDDAAVPLPVPDWPRLDADAIEQLRSRLRRRARALLPHAIDHLLARSSWPMRWATRLLARWQSRGWVDALLEHIAGELRRRDQL